MMWNSHLKITSKIFHEINTTNEFDDYKQVLLDSCIEPDKKDKDNPHHYGREETITDNIMQARRHYLDDELNSTFSHLGYALHYIQDKWTSLPGYQAGHDKWENWINSSHISRDDYIRHKISETYHSDYLVYSGLLDDYSRHYFKSETLQISALDYREGWKPWLDLNFAYRISSRVAKSVIQEPNSMISDNFNRFYSSSFNQLLLAEELELKRLNSLKDKNN